jgi:Protein of unknown function (DUF1194)
MKKDLPERMEQASCRGCSRQLPERSAEGVDLLLVLAADISRSVDELKFQLQRSGYAAAFSDG